MKPAALKLNSVCLCMTRCRAFLYLQKILAEKKARYSELAKRLEREKALALMERRMEIKRHLQVWRSWEAGRSSGGRGDTGDMKQKNEGWLA